jgi:hypothetical protein
MCQPYRLYITGMSRPCEAGFIIAVTNDRWQMSWCIC